LVQAVLVKFPKEHFYAMKRSADARVAMVARMRARVAADEAVTVAAANAATASETLAAAAHAATSASESLAFAATAARAASETLAATVANATAARVAASTAADDAAYADMRLQLTQQRRLRVNYAIAAAERWRQRWPPAVSDSDDSSPDHVELGP